jgi:uncharacterized protein
MTLSPRITIVTLGVADVADATAFYERLGFRRSSASNPNITFLNTNGTVLALFGRESLADDAGVHDSKPGFTGITLAHNLNSIDEVDAAFAHALACGATPVKSPEKVFWGGYSGYFADPDGHLWELAFNPFAPLGPDGHMQLPD